VVTFVQRVEGVDFKGALAILGLTNEKIPSRQEIARRARRRVTSEAILALARCASELIGERLREIGNRQATASKLLAEFPDTNVELLTEEIERSQRQWDILSSWQDDLWNSNQLLEMWRSREALEKILGAPIQYTRPSPEFAAWAADVNDHVKRAPL
jgi:hypothetical protein